MTPVAEAVLAHIETAARAGARAPYAHQIGRALGVAETAVGYHLRQLIAADRIKREHDAKLRRNVWVVPNVGRTG